jgi:creatinine amidohydrolase
MNLAELTWPAIARLVPHTPVVVPVAAMEQHGHHLPLATDSMLLAEVLRRAEPQVGDRVLFAPLLWLGNSHHHLEYPDTLSAGPRTYLDLLGDLIENLLHHGFRRIVFMNGHGGNTIPGRQAVFEARQRHRSRTDLLLLFATYWDFGPHLQTERPDLAQDYLGHACEYETAMMQVIAPGLVQPVAGIAAMDPGFHFEPAYRGWITRERAPTGGPAPGHLGDPAQATPEKGEYLLARYANGVAAFLERVVAWDGTSWQVSG